MHRRSGCFERSLDPAAASPGVGAHLFRMMIRFILRSDFVFSYTCVAIIVIFFRCRVLHASSTSFSAPHQLILKMYNVDVSISILFF